MTTRLTLRSNIASIQTQRRLGSSTEALRDSFTRLSSGLRINKASDDAAGLSIASALETDRRVYAQGIRNLSEGLSYLDIASSAVSELTNITIRLQELAEQAANGVLGNVQREALDQEAQELVKEYNRIIDTTEFNERQLLNPSASSIRLQAGYGENGSLLIDLGVAAVAEGSFTQSGPGHATGNFDLENIDIGDYNGDGILDVISTTAGNGANDVYLALGNGDGSFSAETAFTTPGSSFLVYSFDIDGDGDLDAITGGNGGIGVNLNNGAGDLTTSVNSNSGTGKLTGLSFGDLNGDGHIDVVGSDVQNDLVHVYFGNGDGSFSNAQIESIGSEPGDVEIADVDGDGDLDVIASNEQAGGFSVLLNSGGVLASEVRYNVPTFVSGALEIEDINGDGRLDIVGSGANGLSVYLGNGDGTFGNYTQFQNGGTAALGGAFSSNVNKTLDLYDVNEDGVLDSIVGNSSGSFSILFGNGDGSFQARVSYATSGSDNHVVLGDLNGDGVIDIVSGDNSGSSIFYSFIQNVTDSPVRKLSGLSLATQAEARVTLDSMEGTLEGLTRLNGVIGSAQSRIEVGISNLRSSIENYAAAKTRIMDVDVATEAASLARSQILQQSGVSILAQANIQPQLALALLNNIR